MIGTETGFWDPMDADSQGQRTEKPKRKKNRQKRSKATAVGFCTYVRCRSSLEMYVPIRTHLTKSIAGGG